MDASAISRMLGIMGAALALSALAWWMLSVQFETVTSALEVPPRPFWVTVIIVAALFFIVFALNALIALLVTERLYESLYLILFAALPFLFFSELGLYAIIPIATLLAGSYGFATGIRRDDKSRLTMSIFGSIRFSVGYVITGFLLALSVLYYGVLTTADSSAKPVESIASLATDTTHSLFERQLPGYEPNMTIDGFVLLLLNKGAETALQSADSQSSGLIDLSLEDAFIEIDPQTAASLGIPSNFDQQLKASEDYVNQLLAEQRDTVLGQQIASTRDEILSRLGVDATGDDTVSDVLDQFYVKKLDRFVGTYESLFPPLIAISVFFFLRIFHFFYQFFIQGIAYLLYRLLRAANVIRTRQETVKVVKPTL